MEQKINPNEEIVTQDFTCMICNKKLLSTSSREFLAHVQSHSTIPLNENGDRISCDLCNKTFAKKYYLNSHIKRVHSQVTFKCGQCDAKLKTKYYLELHVKSIHLKTKHECTLCGKDFTSYGNLWVHKKYLHEKKTHSCLQ